MAEHAGLGGARGYSPADGLGVNDDWHDDEPQDSRRYHEVLGCKLRSQDFHLRWITDSTDKRLALTFYVGLMPLWQGWGSV